MYIPSKLTPPPLPLYAFCIEEMIPFRSKGEDNFPAVRKQMYIIIVEIDLFLNI